jgi:hypothetical protein
MSAATRKVRVVSAVVFAGAATLLFMQYQSVRRLKQESQTLEQQAGQLTQLAAENERLSNLLAQVTGALRQSKEQERELLRLRAEVARVRQQNKDVDKVREENRQLRAGLANRQNASGATMVTEAASADYWPKNSWAFAGYATPEASLQSGLWAANSGDVGTFFSSITGDLQAEVQNDLKAKSEAEVKTKLLDEVAKMKSCRIVNRDILSHEEVLLTVSVEEDEKGATISKMMMRKVANEWKFSGKHD